jgi:hypothetical protein
MPYTLQVLTGKVLALEGGKCLGTGTLQALTCKVLACPSWSEPLMYPSDGVYWLGMEGARAVPDLASVGLVKSGGLLL